MKVNSTTVPFRHVVLLFLIYAVLFGQEELTL